MKDTLLDILALIPSAILLLLILAAFVFVGMGYRVQIVPPTPEATPVIIGL
jgi:hypothetical protein